MGQYSIPSDTACYPAKLMHGHVEKLLHERVDAIFYPSLTYNIDEGQGDNHYNCPVVAYYAELIAGNMDDLVQTRFLYPYLNINDPRELTKELYAYLNEHLAPVTRQEVRAAVRAGFAAYEDWMRDIRAEGQPGLDLCPRKWAQNHDSRRTALPYRSRNWSWYRPVGCLPWLCGAD